MLNLYLFFLLTCLIAGQGISFRGSCIPGKHHTTELHSSPCASMLTISSSSLLYFISLKKCISSICFSLKNAVLLLLENFQLLQNLCMEKVFLAIIQVRATLLLHEKYLKLLPELAPYRGRARASLLGHISWTVGGRVLHSSLMRGRCRVLKSF